MDLTRITSRFNFYQQVRTLLHKLRHRNTPADTPSADLLDARLRLISTLSLEAPAGQIASIEQETPEDPLRVRSTNQQANPEGRCL